MSVPWPGKLADAQWADTWKQKRLQLLYPDCSQVRLKASPGLNHSWHVKRSMFTGGRPDFGLSNFADFPDGGRTLFQIDSISFAHKYWRFDQRHGRTQTPISRLGPGQSGSRRFLFGAG